MVRSIRRRAPRIRIREAKARGVPGRCQWADCLLGFSRARTCACSGHADGLEAILRCAWLKCRHWHFESWGEVADIPRKMINN